VLLEEMTKHVTDDADEGSDSSPSEAELSDDEGVQLLPAKAFTEKAKVAIKKQQQQQLLSLKQ
jgi:hypothetical protein